jgi:phosphofructokinase-like protein
MQTRVRRIAISTGGGDCPGLNAVIRAVVKTAINEYGWEVLGIEDGYDGLLGYEGARVRLLTLADVQGILPRGGTILGTSSRSNPFAMSVTIGDQLHIVDRSQEAVDRLSQLGVDVLVAIGGDGSMKIANRLQALGVRLVGIPKTIDNDLQATDLTFGFDTALQTATEAIDKLHTTAESHHRVMIVEVMGRHAGWIGLEAGIAGGADVILIPEIPYELEACCEKIAERNRSGSRFSIVVVAEGAMPVGGQPHYVDTGPGGGRRLGGIGPHLAQQMAMAARVETRATVLGHLQRGGAPSAFDRLLGTRFGVAAVHLIARGGFGRMVALHGQDIVDVPIEDAIASLKLVPPDGELVRVARGLGISFGQLSGAVRPGR